MSENWTIGPWNVELGTEGDDYPVIYVCSQETVCPETTICKFDDRGNNRDKHNLSNAHLIAAAPDLYAALKDIYDTFWGASNGDRIWTFNMQRFAKAALAKARGEA